MKIKFSIIITIILAIKIHLLSILLPWLLFLVNHYLQCIAYMYVGFTIAMHFFLISMLVLIVAFTVILLLTEMML